MSKQKDMTIDRRGVLKTSAAVLGEHSWERMPRPTQRRNFGM